MMKVYEAKPEGKGRRVGIVVSRFNDLVSRRLLDGCREALRRAGVAEDGMEAVLVPGAWEIPPAARRLAETGRFDGLVALGAIVRGETTHHEHISREVTAQLVRLQESWGRPVALGVLTTDTLDQALERSGEGEGNKGAEAALHLLELLSVLDGIR